MANQIPLPVPTAPTSSPTRRTPSDVWREIEDGYTNPPPLSPRRKLLQGQGLSVDTQPSPSSAPNHHQQVPEEQQPQSSEAPQNSPYTPLLHHPTLGRLSEKQYPQRSPSSIWRHIRSGYGPDYNSDSSSDSPPEDIGGIISTENGKSLAPNGQKPLLLSNSFNSSPQPSCPTQSVYYQSAFREHLDESSLARLKKPHIRGLITGDGACGRKDAYYDNTLGEWRVIPPIHVDTESELGGSGDETDGEGGEGVEKASRKRKVKENRLKRVVDCVVDVFKRGDDKDGEPDRVEGPIFGFESIY